MAWVVGLEECGRDWGVSFNAPTSICRLLFPDHSEAVQHSLANQLLEQSGVSYWKRAQDLTVEEFGAVAHNYHNFMHADCKERLASDSE